MTLTRSPRTRPTAPVALTVLLLLATGLAAVGTAQTDRATVTLDDQTIGAATIHVASATLPDGGFVTIHDARLNDGAVLGSVRGSSAFLPAGTHEDVRIHLDTPVTEDTTLVAMPHKDTDGDRVYSFVSSNGQTDGPYANDGGPVVDDGQVTASATTTFSDLPTDGASVLVDRVELAQGGFLAIHDDRLLAGQPLASVIGVSEPLDAGVHHDVRVELDRDLMDEQTLVAMPHEDTDDDRTYDFVTSGGSEDGPYTNASGDPVIDDATVTPSSTATVTFEDQPTGGETLHVAQVFLPEGGFVTMHDSTLADGETFDSVRGTSACLAPGVHRSIRITLDEPLSSSEAMSAMPHTDSDDDCTYDFVTTQGEDDDPYTDDGGIVAKQGQAHLSASISYTAQSSDGRTITIDHVDMVGGGFVAVHDPSLLGGAVLDSVVGHSELLEPGTHQDVEITLEPPIQASQTLIPMPHQDTDGDGTYDFVTSEGSTDGPYTDASGAPIVASARTTVQATATIDAQSSTGTLTVASATMHDGGFVTIHDASLLEGDVLESVIGVSEKLSPGTHEDVKIVLDTIPEGEATMIAMPHKDTDRDRTYDFVTSSGSEDGPYTGAGSAVVDTAEVSFSGPGGDDASDGEGDGASDGEAPAPAPGALALVAVAALAALAAERRQG